VPLVTGFRSLLRELPDDWADARFALRMSDPGQAARAVALLGGIGAGRHGDTVRFFTARRGAGHGPDVVARALGRVDDAHLSGELELVSSGKAEPVPETHRPTLSGAWDAALATLPPDWSDVYAELELTSTDQLERAALLLSPLNPARFGGRPGFRFRVARSSGYGASSGMVRRCLARLDAEDIRGEVAVVHALSDTELWSTQGPVWYVGGKSV
jgi:hypothetical protein